jgi:hypothetical protein
MAGPLLDEILGEVKPDTLEREGFRCRIPACKCLVIAHVHVVHSVVPLFRRLIALGFRPDGIIVVPKPYSTIKDAHGALGDLRCEVSEGTSGDFAPGRYDEAAERMLRRACRRGLVLFESGRWQRCVLIDDGGLLTDEWNRLNEKGYDTISVQQTASGFSRAPHIPVRRVDVARSAAKRFFEAKIIAAGVFRKVKELHVLRDTKDVGVVGMGYVGRAVATELVKRGKTVYTYDKKPGRMVQGCQTVGHWSDCIKNADFIFGCTGMDFMGQAGLRWLGTVGQKHLASLSSRDIEFQGLLRHGQPLKKAGKFGLIKAFYRGAGPFLIMNGGFPVNFDRQAEWESDEAISLTRGLVLLGALQSLYHEADVPNTATEKLSLSSQKALVRRWLDRRLKSPGEYGVGQADFEDETWWYRNSGGAEYKGDWTAEAGPLDGSVGPAWFALTGPQGRRLAGRG